MTSRLDQSLAEILHPMSVEEFKRDYYNKKPLVVRGKPGKFAHLYSREVWLATPPKEPTVSFYAQDPQGVPVSREVKASEAQLADLYDAGLVTVGRVESHPPVGRLLEGLRAAFQVPSRKLAYLDSVLCFASKDSVGWTAHWDVYHVFVLQISGQKRWRYTPSPLVRAPLTPPGTAHPGQPVATWDGQPVIAPRPDDLVELVLEEGDFFYMPPGTWHAPVAQGHSMHLAVAMGQRSVLDLMLDVIKQRLEPELAWREPCPAILDDAREGGEIPPQIAHLFAQKLQDLAHELTHFDPRHFHQEWSANVAALGALEPRVSSGVVVSAEDRLRRRGQGPLRYVIAPSVEDRQELEVFLYAAQGYASLPADAVGFVRALAAHDEFRAADACAWDGGRPWEEVAGVLSALVNEGLLERL